MTRRRPLAQLSGAAPDAIRPTWILLHGTPLTPAVWNEVAAILHSAGQVVAPDISHGVGHPGDQAWHAARVLDALAGDGPLHVVGHSFGGQVAIEVALAAAHRVRSLTVVCSRDTPFPAFASAARSLRDSGEIDVDGTLARWFTAREVAADGAVLNDARTCLRNVDPVVWADDLDAIARFDRSTAVGALRMPIHLVAARDDRVATTDAMTALASRVPHASMSVVEGSHMSPFLDPRRLTEQILGVDLVHR